MKKEEFLAFSLPYGLKFKDTFMNSINLLTGIKSNDNDSNYEGGVYSHGCYMSWINCTPILYPMSDLTKTIEHNGKKFVPIIELAKIGFDVCDDLKIKVKSEDKISGCKFYNEDDEIVIFVYHYETQSFCAHYSNTKLFTNVHYQLKMFQKLIEWKFDVYGLIDKNEAIDVNTLEINPYK